MLYRNFLFNLIFGALTLETYGQLKFEEPALEDVISIGTSSYQFSFPFVNKGAKTVEITKVSLLGKRY